VSLLASALPVTGSNLNRPESIIALADGRLYAADREFGVIRVGEGRDPAARVAWPFEEFVPNGIALLEDGSFLIANVGPDGGAWRLTAPGRVERFLGEREGVPASSLNFLYPDREGRIWLSLCTQNKPRTLAFRKSTGNDGAIGVVRPGGRMEVVASGLGFTNELRVDPSGRWLYVNETFSRRLSRFEILPGDRLGPRQTVAQFGHGTWPDGLEFDAEGGVWVTSIISNRLLRVDPGSDRSEVFLEDCADEALARAEEAFAADRFGWEELSVGRNYSLRNISSLAFAGPDLRTVYLGSLFHEGLPTWRSPVAGHPPDHWNHGATVID
jgi:sugar lactone lactonase YvrE